MGQRAHGLFERGVGIVAVRIEDIDVIETHALERLIQAGQQVFATAEFAIGAGPHAVAGLGGDNHLIAIGTEIAGHDLTEQLFGGAGRGAVIIGEIEMGDARIKGVTEDFHGRGVVAGATEILPQAQADHRQLQARAARVAVLHGVIACRIGPIGHGKLRVMF